MTTHFKLKEPFVYKIFDENTSCWYTSYNTWCPDDGTNYYMRLIDAINVLENIFPDILPKDIPKHYKIYAYDVITDYITQKIKDDPFEAKRALAKNIVAQYHGAEAAILAEKEWDKVHIRKELPSVIPCIKLTEDSVNIVELILLCDPNLSKAEIKRLILQGGIVLNGCKITDFSYIVNITDESFLKVGKRKFFKIIK